MAMRRAHWKEVIGVTTESGSSKKPRPTKAAYRYVRGIEGWVSSPVAHSSWNDAVQTEDNEQRNNDESEQGTFDDIADRELKFHFKHHQTSPDSLQFFANCSFRSDYEFTVDNAGHNENHPNGLQWKFFGARDICGGYRYVQVPPYPTMTISRLRQGGWLFENEHVRLFLGGF